MIEKKKRPGSLKDMSTLTRVFFVGAVILVSFGVVGVLASLIFTDSSWVDSFYSASIYGNTAGALLLLVTTIRLGKDREVAANRARTESTESQGE